MTLKCTFWWWFSCHWQSWWRWKQIGSCPCLRRALLHDLLPQKRWRRMKWNLHLQECPESPWNQTRWSLQHQHRIPFQQAKPVTKPVNTGVVIRTVGLMRIFTFPGASYQDQRVRSQPQTEESQNLQKTGPLFCCGLPGHGGGAGCCWRTGHRQTGQHLRRQQGELEAFHPTYTPLSEATKRTRAIT